MTHLWLLNMDTEGDCPENPHACCCSFLLIYLVSCMLPALLHGIFPKEPSLETTGKRRALTALYGRSAGFVARAFTYPNALTAALPCFLHGNEYLFRGLGGYSLSLPTARVGV